MPSDMQPSHQIIKNTYRKSLNGPMMTAKRSTGTPSDLPPNMISHRNNEPYTSSPMTGSLESHQVQKPTSA